MTARFLFSPVVGIIATVILWSTPVQAQSTDGKKKVRKSTTSAPPKSKVQQTSPSTPLVVPGHNHAQHELHEELFKASKISDSSVVADTIKPINQLKSKGKFIYQLVSTEYITNENDFILDSKSDTCYLIFKKTPTPNVFEFSYHGDENGSTPWKKANLLQTETYVIRFGAYGQVDSLVNWKKFRDIFASSMSQLVRAGVMQSSEFDANMKTLTSERYLRRLAMEDINYLFELSDDTLITNVEYLRIKPVRSPFTSDDFFIQGNLLVERPEGTRNTWLFKTHNQAGPMQKPQLMADCIKYFEKNAGKDEPLPEIQRVGLNSEVEYTYNSMRKAVLKAVFSDVLAINFQSRGNIRSYYLWDAE